MPVDAEAWIDLLLRRAPELRRAGILSIGSGGHSASLAPEQPEVVDDGKPAAAEPDEPSNPWENPSSYPTGHVPSLSVDEDLPVIPTFEDD